MFAKGQFLNAHHCSQGCAVPVSHWTNQETDGIAKRLTFCPRYVSPQVYFCRVYGQWSHLWSVSANTLYQPATQTVCSTSISRQNKRFFLSFHFSPHSSVSVIALIPGIERSCHNLSRSWWLKRPSGDQSFSCEVVHTSIVSPLKKSYVMIYCIFNRLIETQMFFKMPMDNFFFLL